MRRIILTFIILFNFAFSSGDNKEWQREMYYHGDYLTKQEWTKNISQPNSCIEQRESKINEIGMIANIQING